MKRKQKQILLLIILVFLLFAINYSFLDRAVENFLLNRESAVAERVIDGDTIELESGEDVRLLGINSPERGEKYYPEAKKFLEDLILNKTIELETGKKDKDKYKRLLRYIFVGGKNVDVELVSNGFANIYYPESKDVYFKDFEKAWGKCLKENKNLCARSKNVCANCIMLKEFDYKNEIIIFYNKCDFDCELIGWSIKDEGRKKFVFPDIYLGSENEIKIIVGEGEDNGNILFWRGEDYVWTDTGDTLFLRDEDEGLVLWRSF